VFGMGKGCLYSIVALFARTGEHEKQTQWNCQQKSRLVPSFWSRDFPAAIPNDGDGRIN
jgi:hypothetical protein